MSSVALDLAYVLEETIQEMNAIKQQPPWVRQAEAELTRKLQGTMRGAFNEVVNEVLRKKNIPVDSMSRRQLTEAIIQRQGDIQESLETACNRSAEWGRTRASNHLKKHGVEVDIAKTNNRVKRMIRNQALGTSERIAKRGRDKVYESLMQSYDEGLGIDDAAERLRESLDDYTENELRTVARTEINGAQNAGSHSANEDAGIEYEQWWTGDDERVRGNDPHDEADHVKMHGQIVKTGDRFSNGLMFPGDRDGDIKQWINCRCRVLPFIMPEGYMAPPGRNYFYESDLVAREEETKSPMSEEELQKVRDELAQETDPDVREQKIQEHMKKALEWEEAHGRSVDDLFKEAAFDPADHPQFVSPEGFQDAADLFGLSQGAKEKARGALSKASDWIRKQVHPDLTRRSGPLGGIDIVHGSRASYNPGRKLINWDGARRDAMIHEYGHHLLDQGDSRIQGTVKSFFRRRTAGESLTTIYRGTDEKGYRDKFINHYMGKVYPGFGDVGDEVVSMGVEMMSEPRKRRQLYEQDPDMFRLILGLIRGLR